MSHYQVNGKIIPLEGTMEDLKKCGLRYVMTPEFEQNGKKGQLEYMVYQDSKIIAIWKRFLPQEELFSFHLEANITDRIPTKRRNQPLV